MECELLYQVVRENQATRGIEIGMAYGISSLCLADALQQVAIRRGSSARLVSIDSHQTASFKRAGIHLLQRAGYDSVLTVVEAPSQLALPEFVMRGERFDIGFIDGWHTFDHTLVDFFFVDQLLENGGVVVFDDVGYPAVQACVRFILANRDYELVRAIGSASLPGAALRARRSIKRWIRRFARTDADPSARDVALFRSFESASAVVLRKRGADTRRFDHFARF